MKLFWISSLLIFILACGAEETKAPSNLIPKDALISLLADFHIMDAAAKQNIITNNHKAFAKHKQYLGVLKLHGFTKTQFDSTIQYHVKSPEEFKLIYKGVGALLKLKKEKYNVPKEKKEKALKLAEKAEK